MSAPFHNSLAPLLLAAALSLVSGTVLGQATPEVNAAWRVESPSELGHAYQLQANSGTGGVWEPCQDVRFGTGQPLLWQGKNTEMTADMKIFRVSEVDPASIGIAPVVLPVGSTLSLAEVAGSAQVGLFTDETGVYRLPTGEPISMGWSYVKTSADRGKLTSSLENGTQVVVQLQFRSTGGGRFVREYLSSSQTLLDTASGIFAFSHRFVWANQGEGRMPTNLIGQTLTVQMSGLPVTYTFGPITVARRIGESQPQLMPYTYEPESSVLGKFQLLSGGDVLEELTLTSSSPTVGTVTRVKYDQGTPRPAESGSFTRPELADNSTTAHCAAPNSMDSTVLEMSDSQSGTLTMEFGSGGEGTRSRHDGGSIQQSPFTFSYTRVDDHVGRIVTVLPVLGGDEIDELLLTFSGEDDCAGTFTRKHYKNGILLSSSNGTFAPGHPPSF